MSLSRQVLSSPFDAPQRPRTASRQEGDRKRVKEGGSTLAHYPPNIMVDTRVHFRRSAFGQPDQPAGADGAGAAAGVPAGADPAPPPAGTPPAAAPRPASAAGRLAFDGRLLRGDALFANPVATVAGRARAEEEAARRREAERRAAAARRRALATPPPARGRRHADAQTEEDGGRIRGGPVRSRTASASAQTDLRCDLRCDAPMPDAGFVSTEATTPEEASEEQSPDTTELMPSSGPAHKKI